MKFASGSSRHVPEPWKEHRCVRWLREEVYRACLSGRTSGGHPTSVVDTLGQLLKQ